jgi:hypothetical protein
MKWWPQLYQKVYLLHMLAKQRRCDLLDGLDLGPSFRILVGDDSRPSTCDETTKSYYLCCNDDAVL